MLALAFFALAGASEVWIVGRSHGGWRVEVFDPDLTLDALFIAEVASEADANATVTKLKQCAYPKPGAKAGEPCPHLCFTAGVPCTGSSDPHCETSVLMQNEEAPGKHEVLANVTGAYIAVLGHLQAPDGLVVNRLATAVVSTKLYCECPDPQGWFPGEMVATACSRADFEKATTGCQHTVLV
jgi:hypothetical protein